MWDSPEGRAHSYFGLSFQLKDPFYAEFEEDYEPIPKVEWGKSMNPMSDKEKRPTKGGDKSQSDGPPVI